MQKIFLFLLLAAVGCKDFFSPDGPAAPASPAADSTAIEQKAAHAPLKAPAVIHLDSISHASLDVQGVGGQETSELRFMVSDSFGQKADDGFLIQFQLFASEGGGVLMEVSDSIRSGHALCHFKSGITAGTCAVTAAYYDKNLLAAAKSEAVRLLVYGGPPSDSNFTLVPERRNIPFQLGSAAKVTALLYDRYGNPAHSSMVYFTASAGGITAGGLSDSLGVVDAVFTITESAALPSGFVRIAAQTRDGSGGQITALDSLVLSGAPVIVFSPSDTFHLAPGGITEIAVTLSDVRGSPLSAGTEITFALSGGGLLLGETHFTLPDAVSGFTHFQARVQDDFSVVSSNYLSVSVKSPNGDRQAGLWGRVQ